MDAGNATLCCWDAAASGKRWQRIDTTTDITEKQQENTQNATLLYTVSANSRQIDYLEYSVQFEGMSTFQTNCLSYIQCNPAAPVKRIFHLSLETAILTTQDDGECTFSYYK